MWNVPVRRYLRARCAFSNEILLLEECEGWTFLSRGLEEPESRVGPRCRLESGEPDLMSDDPFRRAYDEHVDFVWRLLQSFGVPAAEQEDALQETFLALHKQLHRLETSDDVRRYLCGIVRHLRWKRWRLARNFLRFASETLQGEPFFQSTADQIGSTPEHETSLKDDREMLLRLLDTLDDKKREIFILSDVESFTTEEIAEITGVNPNTVTSRLRAARTEMKKAVQRELARDAWRYRWTT
jgi:RNA polymerase sigma-70 factor (ECF subfamily)